MSEILRADRWGTNARLMADVARLGYVVSPVLDATWGEGNFWCDYQPGDLTTNDRYKPNPSGNAWDFTALPLPDNAYATVVFDPPYRLSGRRDRGEFDQRFGLAEYRSNDEILADIVAGAVECYRVSGCWLLVKCQDQVNGGRMRWQTLMVANALIELGARLIDRFDFLTSVRSQPSDRRQLTARSNYSTLLVFKKAA